MAELEKLGPKYLASFQVPLEVIANKLLGTE
jgi:hypothetical protein